MKRWPKMEHPEKVTSVRVRVDSTAGTVRELPCVLEITFPTENLSKFRQNVKNQIVLLTVS